MAQWDELTRADDALFASEKCISCSALRVPMLKVISLVSLFFFYSLLRSSNQENICELQQPQDLICLKMNGVCPLSVIEKGGEL